MYLSIWCRDEIIDSLNCSVVLLFIDIALARTPFSQNAMTYRYHIEIEKSRFNGIMAIGVILFSLSIHTIDLNNMI